MALDINSYNATFKAFADFAKSMEAPDMPKAKRTTASEIIDVYNALEKHVLAEHQDIVQMEAEAAKRKPVFVDLG